MSKRIVTQFWDLEDLSLRCMFQYLSIRDRFMFFFDFNSSRIQSLLENFLSSINISHEDDQWIEPYVPKALSERIILSLYLKEKQLHFVSKYFSFGDIQTIYLITRYENDFLSRNKCILLGQSLNKLVLLRDQQGENEDIFTYPIVGQNLIFRNLTHLSINLSKINCILNILQRLPILQRLKIHLENSHSCDSEEIDLSTRGTCPMLRHVTITGVTPYSQEFKTFFVTFGSTIQSLILNITIIHQSPLFLIQLGEDVLNTMALLSSLEFRIKWNEEILNEKMSPMDIQILENNNWQRFSPSICYNDTRCPERIIYNFPYKFRCFEIMTNDLNFKSSSPLYNYVQTVLLRKEEPWWSKTTFNFIRNNFPNVQTLFFHSKLKLDYNVAQTYDIRFPELFDDDFRHSDNEIQLPTVTTIYLDIEREFYDYQTFSHLFNLLPNLKTIKSNRPEHVRKTIGHRKLHHLTIESFQIPRYVHTLHQLFHYLCNNVSIVS